MNRLISFGNSDDEFPIYIMQATKDKKIGILDGGWQICLSLVQKQEEAELLRMER